MQKVKRLVIAGASAATAIKESLGGSVVDFAREEGLHPTAVYGVINGSAQTPYHDVRDRLAARLGVDREWLDNLIPVPVKDSSAAA
jgi:hypothetical protein